MVFEKSACIETLYQELPFLERFRAAREDGFTYVEFWSWTDKDLHAVRRASEEAGVGIAGFNGDAELSLIDPEQKRDYLDYLQRSVAAARELPFSHHPLKRPGRRRRSAEQLPGAQQHRKTLHHVR